VQVSGLSAGVRAIAAGYSCSYAIRDDSAMLSWGWNFEGRLGDGSTADRLVPTLVQSLARGVAAVSLGVALSDDRRRNLDMARSKPAPRGLRVTSL
jgi:alpha-tubulin suppressor-like RCC1 family protein